MNRLNFTLSQFSGYDKQPWCVPPEEVDASSEEAQVCHIVLTLAVQEFDG